MKYLVASILAVSVAVSSPQVFAQCDCVTQPSGFAGGDGTPENPYQVCVPEHLDNVRNHLAASFVQTADIDMGSFGNFTPIGSDASRFSGNYNGVSHSISNLQISAPGQNDVGLFSVTETSAILSHVQMSAAILSAANDRAGMLIGKNLGLVVNVSIAADVTANQNIGGLVGRNEGTISNASISGTVTSAGPGNVGGICGSNNGQIFESESTAAVTGGTAGGMVGSHLGSGSITHCKSAGQIDGIGGNTGGLVGFASISSLVQESYSTANVTGDQGVAGLIGVVDSCQVLRSYAAGTISGNDFVGGMVGFDLGSSTITASYWDTTTSGQATSAGGTGLPTASMQMQSTYDPPWDFTNVWTIDEGNDYPRLQWESEPDSTPECVIDCQCSGGSCKDGVCLGGDQPVPAVSEWGIAVLALMTLVVGSIAFRRMAA